MYHPTLGLRVIKKKKKKDVWDSLPREVQLQLRPTLEVQTPTPFNNNYFSEMCSGSEAGS